VIHLLCEGRIGMGFDCALWSAESVEGVLESEAA
jgi:hypothetical protein